MRHLGVVILDLRRCINLPTQELAWPALPLKFENNDRTTHDWDSHLVQRTSVTSVYLLRRHEHFGGKRKTQASAKELER
jgi:hypothetical protein